MRRTQIYLSARDTDVLDRFTAKTGRTRSQLIREAIAARYGAIPDRADAEEAIRRSAGAWKGRRADGASYVERLRHGRLAALHGERGSR